MASIKGFLLVVAEFVIGVSWAQFMPGSSPSSPNQALTRCQEEAGVANVTREYAGQHAHALHQWCSVYDEAIPCLSNLLPLTSDKDPNDWYLSLVFDQENAKKKSKEICTKFPALGNNLTCVDQGLRDVMRCVRWTATGAINHIYALHHQNNTDSGDAAIFACLVSAATSECFVHDLKTCNDTIRQLLGDYYIMLSGKCQQVAADAEDLLVSTTAAEKSGRVETSSPVPGPDIIKAILAEETELLQADKPVEPKLETTESPPAVTTTASKTTMAPDYSTVSTPQTDAKEEATTATIKQESIATLETKADKGTGSGCNCRLTAVAITFWFLILCVII